MPLHYVDPHIERSRRYLAMADFGRSRAGQFVARHVLFHIDPWLYRVTRGRYPSRLGGVASAPLTSTGAKSGQPRVCQLTYFHDGSDVIVLASNMAGPHHPGWYYNLRAHPECRLGDEYFAASEITDPTDYARLFTLAEEVYAGYRDYRAKTALIGRTIPIIRLTPRPTSSAPSQPAASA